MKFVRDGWGHKAGDVVEKLPDFALVLEQEGYLAQPHTSAGRIPSQQGYRLYVDQLLPAHCRSPHLTREDEQTVSTGREGPFRPKV